MKILLLSSNGIQTKLLRVLLPTITFFLILLGAITYFQETKIQEDEINKMSFQIVKARADEIKSKLDQIKLELIRLSNDPDIQTLNWDTMSAKLKDAVNESDKMYNHIMLGLDDGTFYTTQKGLQKKKISNRDFFRQIFSEKREFVMTNVLVSISTGEQKFNLVVPIRDKEGQTKGLLAASVGLMTLAKIAAEIKIGEKGYGIVTDGTGNIIAHPDTSYLMKLNVLRSDSFGFKHLDEIGRKMIAGESGFGDYSKNGEPKRLIFVPIQGTPNWSLAIAIRKSEIDAATKSVFFQLILFFILTIISIYAVTYVLSKKFIEKPLSFLTKAVEQLSEGNLYQAIDYKSNDEVGRIAEAVSKMSLNLKEMVDKINNSATQLNTGSQEIMLSSSTLAQGASQQAASNEEISASIEEIAASINENSDNAAVSAKNAVRNLKLFDNVKNSFDQTISSLIQITDKIKIVHDIAGKTELLALNAAIEAAKAGIAGKGFNVVATEIRKLAETSKKASIEIDVLSSNTIHIANQSGSYINQIEPGIKQNAQLLAEIAAASIEQNAGVEQINASIQQFSSITQINAAAAESMATNAEQLNKLSEKLVQTLHFFKLKQEDDEQAKIEDAVQKLKNAMAVLGLESLPKGFTEELEAKIQSNSKTAKGAEKFDTRGFDQKYDSDFIKMLL